MPSALDLDDVCALLANGTNIVTTRDEFAVDGFRLGPEGRARGLAEAGSTTPRGE